MKNIILASGSADRREILNRIVVPFKTIITDIDEDSFKSSISDPIDLTKTLAEEKAKAAKKTLLEKKIEGIIIAADTLVELNGQIIGKPLDEKDAFRILKLLINHAHNLITGIAITETSSPTMIKDYESTKVEFLPLTDEEIRNYLKCGEWKGRAGAYSIRDRASLFIKSIEGSPSNVIGLSMHKIFEHLKQEFNLNLLTEY